MCKKSSSTDALPSAASRRSSAANLTSSSSARTASSTFSATGPRNTAAAANISSSSTTAAASSSSRSSGRSSLAAARASLPDPPVLYSFQELAAATNSFLAKRASDSSDSAYPYWRCVLRARHAALFQLRSSPGLTKAAASAALARVARYHHTGLAPLLGACLAGPHVYLAYELPDPSAATLAACLQPRKNQNNAAGFTVLRTWLSRVQIAADVAQGLDYVHTHAAQIHGRVSPSVVLVSDPGLRARLTHFGASQFAAAESDSSADAPSKEADVYAFGVLLLGLLSGEAAAARHRFDGATGEFVRVTVVETAAEAARSGRVRGWVDRRLGDSFPVAAAERLVEVGIRCAAAEAADRPDMSWAAGKVSKAYVESIAWEHSLRPPTNSDFSVSLAPR